LERRLATILFADLVDSTRLAAALDPEDWHATLAAAHAALAETVTQYGGYVAQYLGDGLLALFGAPTAHEDDAARAVLAGLRMHQALAAVNDTRSPGLPALRVRVGLATGEVVTGTMGNAYGVRGDAANTAARVQGAAEPGGVLVDGATRALAQRRVRFGERQDLTLKGKAEVVAAYPALAARETLVERWEVREQRTPLVGREEELGRLSTAWRRARGGEGQLITVIGEAGVGKSRLVAEALERIMAEGEVRVLRARALSYGQQMSLWLVADLLRALCGLREQDPLEEVRTRLRATLTALLAGQDAETRASALDVLGEVLGLPIGSSPVANAGAQARRHWVIRSLRLLWGALSVRGPVVLALEDLHWSDEGSAAVLAEVLGDVPGLRALVLASQRPGWSAPWIEWGWAERLTLHTLGAQDGLRLAEAVLGGVRLSPDLERHAAERAGGNPFFVEELLRALQEAGELMTHEGQAALAPGAAERLPATLTEVLLARLDRLGPEARSLAQVASVLGRTFPVRLLAWVVGQDAALLEPLLGALQRAEIVFPRPSAEPEYIFKHATLREVAYHTLLQRRRQAVHRAAAQAIIALYPAAEYVEIIAHHFNQTEEHADAATWLERAGDYAGSIFANAAALGHYEEARRRLELTGADERTLARLDEKLGAVLRTMARYEEALAVLDQAVATYRVVGDLESVGRTIAAIGRVHSQRDTPSEGIDVLRPVLAALEGHAPTLAMAELYVTLAELYYRASQYNEELVAAQHAASVAGTLGDERLLAEAEFHRGNALIFAGWVEEGQRVLAEASARIEAVGNLHVLCDALTTLGNSYVRCGAVEASIKCYNRAVGAAERLGDPAWMALATGFRGIPLFFAGHWDEARVAAERGVALSRLAGNIMWTLRMRAILHFRRGEWELARQDLDEGVALCHASGNLEGLRHQQPVLAEQDILEGRPGAAADRLTPLLDRAGLQELDVTGLLPTLAWAYLEQDDVQAAAEVVRQAVGRARAQTLQLDLVEALRVQAMVACRQEEWDDARRDLDEGLALAGSMPYPHGEARLLHVYGDMHSLKGELEPARERLEEALTIFRRLGARKDAERVAQAMADLSSSA
jgi:adenylate cyclase